MEIKFGYNAKLKCTSYSASVGCKNVRVDVFEWPQNKVHVVACANGIKPLSFHAESFEPKNALRLLELYAIAYL